MQIFGRSNKNRNEAIKIVFGLANQYIEEKKILSLLTAFKLLSTLYKYYPDKAVISRVGDVKQELDNRGVLNLIDDLDVIKLK